jgi:hypothetical protein
MTGSHVVRGQPVVNGSSPTSLVASVASEMVTAFSLRGIAEHQGHTEHLAVRQHVLIAPAF